MSATTEVAAADGLRDAVNAAVRPMASAVVAVRNAQAALGTAEHVTDTITAAAALIVAVEGLEDASKAVATNARVVLRDAMIDAGCWNLGGEMLTVTLTDAPRLPQITDAKALAAAHPELMTTPEPQPDRKKIAEALKRAAELQGAHLSGDNRQPQLRITTRKK